MNNFFPLTVKELKKTTADSVSITFEVPENLKTQFIFQEGQYLTLKAKINGENVQRAYSIWKAPYENELAVLVKKVADGVFSTYANEKLVQGDTIEVMAPQGNFVPELESTNSKHYSLFAAGSGITPIFSILKQILKTEPSSTIDLFYVNKTKSSTIFDTEINTIGSPNLLVHNMYTKEPATNSHLEGRIDKDKCDTLAAANLLKISSDEFYLCGPERMILDVKDYLISQNVNESKIKFELFTTAGSDNVEEIVTDFSEAQITMTIDDDDFEYTFNVGKSESILEEGINQGLDLPYSCKGGVCCTCRAKVMEGSAKMKINYALTDQEVADGYVLTCQTIPTSPVLKVSFDD